ncbi:MAG: ABC transporter permease, partial [Candidatus Methylomirabilales bacterium]
MGSVTTNQDSASIRADAGTEGIVTLTIAGRLDSHTTGKVWREATVVLNRTSASRIVVDASQINYCDGSGIGFFLDLQRRQQQTGGGLEIRALADEFQRLLELFDPTEFGECCREEPKTINVAEEAGRATVKLWADMRAIIAFVGELFVALLAAVLRPRQVRWKDAFLVAETAGVNALPIIMLLGFLMGLIIGFQSVAPLQKFGAEIFVAQVVGLITFKELGPLVTGILLAGRSGSAVAAELGTMKVNEEL